MAQISLENSQKTTDSGKPSAAPLQRKGRYRTLSIALLLLALFTTAVLSTQYYLSSRIGINFARNAAINSQIYLHDKFLISLSAIKNATREADKQKYAAYAVSTFKSIDEIYDKLANGGDVVVGHPEERTIHIPKAYDNIDAAASENDFNKWRTTMVKGRNVVEQLENYLAGKGELPDFEHVYALEIAKWAKGYTFLFQSRDYLIEQERRLTRYSEILQLVAMAFLIIAFGYLVFMGIRRLTKADAAAEAARQETTEIMETVTEGLFLIDDSLTIATQYSKVLEKILGTQKIAQRNLSELLGQLVSRTEVETVNSFIKQLFNARVKENLIHDLNPLDRVQIHHDNQRGNIVTRWLSFQFNRVYRGKKVERILVSVKDITDAVQLEQRLAREQEQNNQQIEMLANILRIDAKMLNGFLLAAKLRINKINNILRRPHHRPDDLRHKVDEIFHEIHSLKGEASVLNLSAFITLANELEDKLQKLRRAPNLSGDDFLSMTIILDQIIELTKRIELLNRRISDMRSGSSNGDSATPEFSRFLTEEAPASEQLLQEHLGRFATQIAERTGKNVAFRSSGLDSAPLDEPQKTIIKDLIIQMMRNAIVHGIESPAERQQAGKHAEGKVQVHLHPGEKGMELVIEDDGRGINFDKLRERAAEMEQFRGRDPQTLSKKELFGILFADGYSTADEVSEDAGRGVGMGIIRKRIIELQGRMSIASSHGQYTRFTICFGK
ncbi:MAG: ATP-binding protein [Cardiobacteriaceae bacterium]|nr:ATP-binding protein [Cardiobacteriaceae bacterium]